MDSVIVLSLAMHTRISLRLKVALVFSALTILLLTAQALGVKALAEVQEERFIDALIADDMRDLMQSYRMDPKLIPPLEPRLGGRVSQEGGLRMILPAAARELPNGTHEIVLDGREIHVAVAPFGDDRVYRIYDYSTYERHFKRAINALMIGTGVFALLTIWLAFGLSGLLVRQVAGLAHQVKALRPGVVGTLNSGKYDEVEVVDLVETFNDYHRCMADMIEREKEFTGNVSHELRTPLTTIKTSCELLEQDAAIIEKSRARLQQIERAANNMIELVNALLLLARDESAAEIGPVRLAGTIADALDGFADALAAKAIETVLEVDSELRVDVNRSALAIVLSNLIDNAVQHTEPGRIRFSYVAGDLCIEDSGSGISPDSLPQVFERFYRASTANGNRHGFGIGLAIVKKICDRYQWSIRIESEVGIGTRVSLHLPLVK
jgi:signal transduction histidine kinase